MLKLLLFTRVLLIYFIQDFTHLPELLGHHLTHLFLFVTLKRPQLPVIFLEIVNLFLKLSSPVFSLLQPALEILTDIDMELSLHFEGVTLLVPCLPALVFGIFKGLQDQLLLGQLSCQKFGLIF